MVSPVDFSTWLVLSRPDCSLCDEMLADLYAQIGEPATAIRVQDISDDAELARKYGQRIPVLLIDGDLVCAYHLDLSRLRGYLTD